MAEWPRGFNAPEAWNQLVELESDLGILLTDSEEIVTLMREQPSERRQRLLTKYLALNVYFIADALDRACDIAGAVSRDAKMYAATNGITERVPLPPRAVKKRAASVARRWKYVRDAVAHPYRVKRNAPERAMTLWEVLFFQIQVAQVGAMVSDLTALRGAWTDLSEWVVSNSLLNIPPMLRDLLEAKASNLESQSTTC